MDAISKGEYTHNKHAQPMCHLHGGNNQCPFDKQTPKNRGQPILYFLYQTINILACKFSKVHSYINQNHGMVHVLL